MQRLYFANSVNINYNSYQDKHKHRWYGPLRQTPKKNKLT